MAPTSRPTRHRPKSDTESESPVERAFRHGNVKRDAVLMVLDSTMPDARKLAYLRAWVTDSPMQEPTPADKQVCLGSACTNPRCPTHGIDWSCLPAYTPPTTRRYRHSPISSSPRVGVES